MHYEVDGQIIKSENTAKPYTLPSGSVLEYLSSQKRMKAILDLGCGKLRYSHILANRCERATFVDSRVQLSRPQVVRGERTTVSDYVAKNYDNCQTVAFEELEDHHLRYDFITCINVLSAIPCETTLVSLLAHIRRLLRGTGKAVFVNQHRNSYFGRFNSGKAHLYGYVFKGTHGSSYYGILGPEQINELLQTNAFTTTRTWCKGESTFVEATAK